MNIGEAARRSGLPAKTIRYYEDIGLVSSARRGNGFRDYDERDVHSLRFVAKARSLGFTVEECRHLLALYKDPARSSAEVREAAERHIADVRSKIAELQSMEDPRSFDQCLCGRWATGLPDPRPACRRLIFTG